MDFYDTTHFMLDPIFEIGSLINVKDKEGIYIIENILADSNEDPPTICYSLFQKSPGGKFIPRQKQERDIVYKCNLIKSLSHPSRYDSLKVGDIIYHAPLSLTMFNRTTQGTFLKILLPYIDELVTSQRPLTSIEYIDLIAAFMFNYASPLSEQELKVIHLLQEHPIASLEELRSISSIPTRKLNAHVNALREKLYFSKYYRINYCNWKQQRNNLRVDRVDDCGALLMRWS